MSRKFIETYGDPHLHSGYYPIAENEKEMHRCEEGMYCDNFPADYRSGPIDNCPSDKPVVVSVSMDPRIRYKSADDNGNYQVGVGCMNLNCMCKNCHGDCKCGNCQAPQQALVENFGLGCGCTVDNATMTYLVLGLGLFAFWFFYLKKK